MYYNSNNSNNNNNNNNNNDNNIYIYISYWSCCIKQKPRWWKSIGLLGTVDLWAAGQTQVQSLDSISKELEDSEGRGTKKGFSTVRQNMAKAHPKWAGNGWKMVSEYFWFGNEYDWKWAGKWCLIWEWFSLCWVCWVIEVSEEIRNEKRKIWPLTEQIDMPWCTFSLITTGQPSLPI